MALAVAMFAGACADEDLDVAASITDAGMTLPGVAAGAPRSVVVVSAPTKAAGRGDQPPLFYKIEVRGRHC